MAKLILGVARSTLELSGDTPHEGMASVTFAESPDGGVKVEFPEVVRYGDDVVWFDRAAIEALRDFLTGVLAVDSRG